MSAAPSSPTLRHLAGCGWFWAWVVVGVGAAVCALALGLLFAVPVVAACVWLAQEPSRRRGAFGLLSGFGLVLLYVAYLQRHGPGTHCWHDTASSGCVHGLDPVPWLVAGLVCFVGGVVGHAWRNRA